MKNSNTKINMLQMFTILALMNGLSAHVIVNPMVLDASGRDSWIAVLLAGAGFILWSLLLVWLMRKSGQQKLFSWLSNKTHPIAAWLLIAPILIEMYLVGGMTVIQTARWNITNYLPSSPELLLVILLVIICSILSLWGLRVIAIASGILLPVVIVLGIFVGITNSPQKDNGLLLPVLEKGWAPVLNGMVYAGGGFVELIVLIALQHQIKSKANVWKTLSYALFLIIITLGPLVGAITEFGPAEATSQITSPYEQWRLVKIGQYIEHVDFFSIFQWLSGSCIRISLAVFLFVEMLPIQQARYRIWAILTIMCSYVMMSLSPVNEYDFYLWMYHYYMPISFIVLFTLSFLWMSIALLAKPAQEETT